MFRGLAGPDRAPLALRVRSASQEKFRAGFLTVANLLDSSTAGGTSGRVAEALASGAARNLSEAIDQLNPAERNALQARWGRSLEELISLSNERDARVFYHGLLQVGRRLEENDQVDLAGVVYSGLVAEGGGEEVVPPLRLRGGQEGLLSSDVANQAQRRLNAITGVGDWRERFAFSLQRIPNQATRWDVLLAMTGAGFTFRGFRLLTTASWAGSFESALALNAASASTAFLAETIAFTSLGKVAGALAGHPQDTSATGIFNEWAGGAAMLLGLKGMGAITGAGVRSIYGEAGAVGARHAVPLRRFTEIFAPQAGMFMGILVGNRLAEAGGFHPERHGDTWLVDGITTLIEFNVAGRIQRAAGGPALISLEARMEAMTRNIGHGSGRPGETGDGLSKDRPLPGVLEWMSEHFRPEFATPEGLRLPAFENRPSKIENILFSVRDEDGTSSAKGPAPARLNDLKYLQKTLRRFYRLKNSMSDPDEIALLSPLLRLFNDQGLKSLVSETLNYAKNILLNESSTEGAIDLCLDLGEAAVHIGRQDIAHRLYTEGSAQIPHLEAMQRAPKYARLAALQKEIGDPEFQTSVDLALDTVHQLPSDLQAAVIGQLSQFMVRANEPGVARALLNEVSGDDNIEAKANLASFWAQRAEQNHLYLSYALTTFREARADLLAGSRGRFVGRQVGQKLLLAKALQRAGAGFEDEHREVLEELEGEIVRIGNLNMRQGHFQELAFRFAEAGEFDKALRLADHELRSGKLRSEAYATIAREMAYKKLYLEALHLLSSRNMLSQDRFFALLNLHFELKGLDVPWKSTAKQVLNLARREISRFKDDSQGLAVQGWLDLAMSNFDHGRPTQAWYYLEKSAQMLFSDDIDRKPMMTGMRQLVLDQFELLNLGRPDWNTPRLLSALQRAQAKQDSRTVAQIALALGFREGKITNVSGWNLKTWAWFLLGASMRPNAESETFLIDHGVSILGQLERNPHAGNAKTHLILLQAFDQISPGLTENVVSESAELSMTRELGFSTILRETPRSLLRFDTGNPILYQNLSWLARRGDPKSRANVQRLIDLPQFPPEWRKPLERALAKRRAATTFISPDKARDLN